jgi:4,5-epoxidase
MVDVVVAGAGPTGLAAACGLIASGCTVRIVDSAPAPATTSRANGLQARGVEILDRLGATGDLRSSGLPVRTVAAYVNRRLVGTLRVGEPTRLVRQPGVLTSQALVEGALRDRLGELGGKVEWATAVEGIGPDDSGVDVRTSAGETIRAGWLVGCDGAHSTVRKLTGVGFPGVPLVESFLLADVRADLPLPHETVHVWLHEDRMIGAFPLPDGVWRLMGPGSGDAPDAALAAAFTELSGLPIRLTDTVWSSTFRIQRRLADTYRTGRVLLAGDAAHIHSPLGGQGMNTGLGDADNLAWKLGLVVAGRAGIGLLDTYQAERRPIAETVLSATTAQARLVIGDGPVTRLVRDRLFAPLLDLPLTRRIITDATSQLRISYRRGPLANGSWRRRGQRPGDRVADLPCRTRDGALTTLRQLLDYRWVLVVPADPAGQRCAAQVADRLGDIMVVTPERGRLAMLVRPDGHIGWRGRPERIGRWLDGLAHGQV